MEECVCPECNPVHERFIRIRNALVEAAQRGDSLQEQFHAEMRMAQDGFLKAAEYLGKGVLSYATSFSSAGGSGPVALE